MCEGNTKEGMCERVEQGSIEEGMCKRGSIEEGSVRGTV